MSDYPEHEKMRQAIDSGARDTVQRFLDWLLDEKEIISAVWVLPAEERLEPVFLDRAKIMAEFFEIDLDKIEQEKRAMLQTQRNLNQVVR